MKKYLKGSSESDDNITITKSRFCSPNFYEGKKYIFFFKDGKNINYYSKDYKKNRVKDLRISVLFIVIIAILVIIIILKFRKRLTNGFCIVVIIGLLLLFFNILEIGVFLLIDFLMIIFSIVMIIYSIFRLKKIKKKKLEVSNQEDEKIIKIKAEKVGKE